MSDSEEPKETPTKPWTYLSRTYLLAFISFLYAGIFIAAWTITAISVYQPINMQRYSYDKNTHWSWMNDERFATSANWLRWARVLQSVASVLTVPLILGVCSQTAVLVLQGRYSRNMTLRQTMALADKGWADVGLLGRMIFRWRWKQHGSPFFYMALALTLLGALVSPIQELFVSYKTIKVAAGDENYGVISDLDQLGGESPLDESTSLLATRARFVSTYPSDLQPRLWTNGSVPCILGGWGNQCDRSPNANDTYDMSQLNYYWAELPMGFDTGVVTQFAPRINHSATFQDVDPEMWPKECAPGVNQTLYLEYFETNEVRSINTTVCFPRTRQNTTLQDGSRQKQDLFEEMYLRVGYSNQSADSQYFSRFVHPGQYAARLQLKTTVGFFELPNYANDLTAGPLLGDDPYPLCDANAACADQLYGGDDWSEFADILSVTPLLTAAVAVFGNTSSVARPMAYDHSNCSFDLPLLPLFGDRWFRDEYQRAFCPPYQKENYLWFLLGRGNLNHTDMEALFEAAAFLATDTRTNVQMHTKIWHITQQAGIDYLAPKISPAGIIAFSSLLGVFLLCLLSLVVFNTRAWRWTTRLDAFTMMRIGAIIHDKIPLEVVSNIDEVKILDETPGWIGDNTAASDDPKAVHTLALGVGSPLDGKHSYQSHQGSIYARTRPTIFNPDGSRRDDPSRRYLLVSD